MAYNDFISAINTYYENPDTWQEIMSHIVTGSAAEVAEYLKNTPYVDYQLLNDGRIGDYYIVNVLDGFNQTTDIGNVINSNNIPSVGSTSVNVGIPSVISKSTTTGQFSGFSGIGLTPDTGVTVHGVLKTVGLGLIGVGVGATIGKIVGDALYNANPDLWATGNLSKLSETDFNKFVTTIKDERHQVLTEGALSLWGVNGDTTTMYVDENAVAYMAWYYVAKGLLEEKKTINDTPQGFPHVSTELPVVVNNSPLHKIRPNGTILNIPDTGNAKRIIAYNKGTDPNVNLQYTVFSDVQDSTLYGSYTFDGKTVYYKQISDSSSGEGVLVETINQNPFLLSESNYLAWLGMYNANTTGVEGITNNPNSTQFNPTGIGSVATSLGALKNQYPELWDKAIKKSVPQEDGTEDEHVYVPIPIPKFNGAFDTQPTTGTPSQSDPSISPDTTPDDELNNASNTIAPPSTPTDDPNTGGGNSPSIVVPSQQASALWAIYNPSLAQLNQLGAWLWSTNFIDQILKIFNDPMQAIIGLHKVYTTPNISGTGNIKVGYLDSGVGSNIVGNQYTYIDCGTVSLREYYGNILDYSPYTTVQLYLPFIGIVPLDVADVTRASISVKYGVDVLTGACLASVSVQRDNAGGVLYQYSGNCACQYPLSSGSYMGMLTGAIGAVGSLAKGNIFGTALSIAGMHTSIEHSGGFSGNAGAMGGKKPYLIVSRPQTAMNDGFPAIQGYPSNVFVTLGSCTGYIQVADCHVENISATDKELEKIKQLLKEGVIL